MSEFPSLSKRDLSVLNALVIEGPLPKAELFWRYFATDEERQRRGYNQTGEVDYKRGHVPLVRLEKHGLVTITDVETISAEETCSEDDCDYPAKAKGLCEPHYNRLLKFGDPSAAPLRRHPRKMVTITDKGRAARLVLTSF